MIYYMLSQKKEIWSGTVGMFDLSEQELRYYEMKVQRGLKKNAVLAEYETMEESFSLDIRKHRPARSWEIRSCAPAQTRLMQRKLYFRGISDGKRF